MNEVKVKLSRPQLSVKTSRASLVLDMAGQGSGKTLNISIDVIEKVRSVPRAIGFIGAKHSQTIITIDVKKLLQILEGYCRMDEVE